MTGRIGYRIEAFVAEIIDIYGGIALVISAEEVIIGGYLSGLLTEREMLEHILFVYHHTVDDYHILSGREQHVVVLLAPHLLLRHGILHFAF